jgi:hypothetical protein
VFPAFHLGIDFLPFLCLRELMIINDDDLSLYTLPSMMMMMMMLLKVDNQSGKT